MENQDKIAFWKLLFKEHEESRLSLNEFCAKKQVKQPTYHYWKKRLIELEQLRNEAENIYSQEIAFVNILAARFIKELRSIS